MQVKAKKLAVTSKCWSPRYKDLFAVSYGSCKYGKACLKWPLSKDQKMVFKINYCLMQGKAKKLAVTNMCWSPRYKDLFAVSYGSCKYSKTCVKQSLSKRGKFVFQDQLSLNAGQSQETGSHINVLESKIQRSVCCIIWFM